MGLPSMLKPFKIESDTLWQDALLLGPESTMNVCARNKFISRMVPVIGLLLVALPSLCLGQQRAKLEKVEFVGLKRLSPEQAIAMTGLQVGQIVEPKLLDAVAGKLMESGLFRRLSYRVRSADDQATVIFDVEEAATNLPVVFENFVWFTDAEILAAIRRDVPFFDGTAPLAGGATDKIAAALQKLLTEKNIPGRVEFLPSVAKGKQELVFTVKGAKIPVCALHFPGAAAIPEAELIKSSQQLLKRDYSRPDISGFATQTLIAMYRHIGRLRAQFQQPTASTEPRSAQCAGGVSVTIPVDEGIAYSWAEAEWKGNQVLLAEELSATLGMKAGEVADGLKIDNGIKKVRKAYGQRGYMAADVKESSELDDASGRVSYRFVVAEGPRYFMGKLIINGLSAEDAERLKAKWTLGTNAVFNESYVEDFRQTGLREFLTSLVQRSPGGSGARVEVEEKSDPQKQTVDVIITFR
jgi:outer membrane protein assembly factor BamA